MNIAKDALVARKRLKTVQQTDEADTGNAFFVSTEMGTGGFKMARDEPFYSCPKYKGCSVNACPLDPGFPRYTDEMDKEQVCKLNGEEKIKIASKFPNILKSNGLTDVEMKASI